MYFISPTFGRLNLVECIESIENFIKDDPSSQYRLAIGTDSQTSNRQTVFVTAMIIHRIGRGARFFFNRVGHKPIFDLRHRIYLETGRSLSVLESLQENGLSRLADLPVEIHLDIGKAGDTRKVIQEVVGWVTSVGYVVRIKPHSYGASSVADRYTKSSIKC